MLGSDYDPEGFTDVVDRVDRVLYLRTLSFVSGLPARDLEFVAALLRPRKFSKGHRLIEEGRPVAAIHLISEGRVRVRRHGAAFREFGVREAVGVYGLLARTPEGVEATALATTRTLELRADVLREVFEERFSVFMHVLRQLGLDLIEERRHIPDNAGLPPRGHAEPRLSVQSLDLVQRMFFLRQSQGFEGAGVFAIAALARHATERRFRAGEQLWREGDSARDVWFLVSGAVVGSVAASAHEFEFGPGDTMGGADAVAGKTRWYATRARQDSIALSIPMPALLDVFEDHLDLGVLFLSFFARRILGALERRAQLGPLVGQGGE